MKIISYLNMMNEIGDSILDAKVNYQKIVDEYNESKKQLICKLPESIEMVPIDQEMLIQRALISPTEKTKLLVDRYENEIRKQKQLYNDIEDRKYSESETHQLIHNNASTQREINALSKQLFQATFGNNMRYHLLDKNTIGENILF
jgi:non-homologous end joining protein Ku